MSPIESAWYAYAKAVAGVDGKHRQECVSNRGAGGTPGLDSSIRWPGYLGSGYTTSRLRLLCVGQVHHATDLLKTLGHIQPLLERLGSGPEDQALMAEITAEYERALPKWGPWNKFRKIVAPLNMSEKSIAYTNVAKCWQTLSDKPEPRYPMKACARRFPVVTLAGAIQAQAIVIMSAESVLDFVGIIEGAIPIYSFPGRPSDAHLERIAHQLFERFVR